jgi:ATP-binding cassette, subfamily B, bacterial
VSESEDGVFRASGFKGGVAVAASLLATFSLVLMIPVLYFTVDLLVWQGHVAKNTPIPESLNGTAKTAIETAHTDPVGLLATVVRQGSHPLAGAMTNFANANSASWSNEGWLAQLAIAAVVLILIRLACLHVAAHLASLAAIDATQVLRRTLYQHCFRINALATQPEEQTLAGELMTTQTENIQDGWIASRTTATRTLALTICALVVLLLANFWLGLAVLFLGGFVWLLAGQSAAWARRDARRAARRGEAQMGILRESLRLLLIVKCYLMERFSTNRVERQLAALSTSARRQYRGDILSRPTLFLLAALAGMVLLYLAGRAILGGSVSLATVAVQGACALALTVSLLRWLSARVVARKADTALDDVEDFLDRRTDASQDIDAKFLQPLADKLDLLEVSYREPGTGRMILEGVSISVKAGQRAAVVCSTAQESRTLAHLMLRFLDPSGGEVRIDGKNVRWVTFESLRTQVAMVLPDHTTFTDTVANNIGCGDSFTLPKIVEAAKLAHAHGFVQHLPGGYETVIGDGGYLLRPGERYRLALARALLRDPAVLILEEPAEPFDADSAALIDDAIHRLGTRCTVVMLARRSTTVRKANSVFVIVDGKNVSPSHADAYISGSQLYKALANRA